MIQKIKRFYISFFNFMVTGIAPNELNDILVLRLDELGDFVLWLDSAKELRRLYPGQHITLLVNEKWQDLARSLSYWDDVVAVDTDKFRFNPIYRFNMLLFIRKKGFSVVLCPRFTVQHLLEPAIVAISGAEQKIIYAGSFPVGKRNYYSRAIQSKHDNLMELNRNAEFIRGMGLKDFKSTVPKIEIPQRKNGMRYVVVCPTTYRLRKEWPLENFIELMGRIHLKTRMPIILCSDRKLKTKFPDYVRNVTGKSNMTQFVEMIKHAQFVVANDSGPIHLAAALDVPSVCIVGGGHFGRFFPYEFEQSRDGMKIPKIVFKKMDCYNCEWHCIYKTMPRPCVKDITVEQVWEVVKELI